MSTVTINADTIKTTKAVELSAHAREEIEELLSHFPADQKKSALLGALNVVQHENQGFLTEELMTAVAEYLDLAKIEVYEVATFYSMYELKPVARNNVAICTNICCMLMGSGSIVEHVEKKLGIKVGESTADGRIYLKKEEECLAACAGGPMMQVNHVYYENLTAEKVDRILDSLE
jgi:NADH-quinone oxidoreductase subunit E